MSDNGNGNANPKIDSLDVYKRLWANRDFELTTFWQRSIFLGTFLTLSYTGYGALCLKLLETKGGEAIWQVGNLFAIVIACFGIIVSTLWILMAKGSKLWYEWQETAISAFVHDLAPKSTFGADYIQEAAAFKIGWTGAFDNRWRDVKKDKSFLSPNGGPFSVSKITICIGQLSLIGWVLIGISHFVLLTIGRQKAIGWITGVRGGFVGWIILFSVFIFVFYVLRQCVESGVLSKKM